MTPLYHSGQDIPQTSGIYRILCKSNNKMYIGSAINLQKRRREHFSALERKGHSNRYLQHAYSRYGRDAFSFEVVELVLPPFLLEREQYWMDKLDSFNPSKGYNIDRTAGSRMGHSPSQETREKLRQANLGKKYSEETKLKHSIAGKSRTHRPESKEKIRQTRIGTKRDQESRERSRLSHLGKKASDETKAKMSLARKGHVVSAETRAKSSASNIASNAWRMKTLIVTAPDGTEYIAHGIGQFCKQHNLNSSALIQVAKGKVPHHKKWTARYPDATDDLTSIPPENQQ